MPTNALISLELKVSPETVEETVSVLFDPGLLKSKNWVWLPLTKSSGKVKDWTPVPPAAIFLPPTIVRFREIDAFDPVKVKETVLPPKVISSVPTVLVYPTTNETWVSGHIGSPRTPPALISRLVIATLSCEKTLVVCIKNTRTNNLKKYLISFLILISFNVSQN